MFSSYLDLSCRSRKPFTQDCKSKYSACTFPKESPIWLQAARKRQNNNIRALAANKIHISPSQHSSQHKQVRKPGLRDTKWLIIYPRRHSTAKPLFIKSLTGVKLALVIKDNGVTCIASSWRNVLELFSPPVNSVPFNNVHEARKLEKRLLKHGRELRQCVSIRSKTQEISWRKDWGPSPLFINTGVSSNKLHLHECTLR